MGRPHRSIATVSSARGMPEALFLAVLFLSDLHRVIFRLMYHFIFPFGKQFSNASVCQELCYLLGF